MTPHAPHHILSMLVHFIPSFLRLGTSFAWSGVPPWYKRWQVFEILRRLFWGAYFQKCFRVLKKKYPFPGRSNRDMLTHITCRQVQISLLYRYAPDCTFSSRKMKKLPTVGGGTGDTPLPHPPPARSLRSLGLGRFAPSQRLCPPPKCFGSLRHCVRGGGGGGGIDIYGKKILYSGKTTWFPGKQWIKDSGNWHQAGP